MESEKCQNCQAELVLDEENLCAYCELNQESNVLNELTQNRTLDIPLDVNCGTCKVIVEEDSEGLFCDVCNSWFHNNCNETPLNYKLYALLNKAPDNVKWFCDKCIWETDKWIQSVNKHYRTSKEIGKSKKKIKAKKEANKEMINETNVVVKVENNEEEHSDYDVHSPAIPETILEEYENEDRKKEEIFNSLDTDEPGLTRRGKSYKKKLLACDKLRIHNCTQCYYKTNKKFYLHQHMKTHTHEKLSCHICGKILKCKLTLKRHLKYFHSDENMELINCMECDYKSMYPRNVRRHMALHSCTECDYKDKNTRNVKAHMAVHTKSNEIFSCHMCGKLLSSKRTLQHHLLNSHSDGNLEIHRCTVCDFKSTYKGSLDTHMREVHATEKAFECKECNQSFVTKNRLKKHLLTHLPYSERPLACDQCDARFYETRNLRRHKLLIHTKKSNVDTPTYFCDICNKGFKGSSYLKLHKMEHAGERPFKCDKCGKDFVSKGKLNHHVIQVHNKDIINCYCEICGYGAHTQSRLNKHMADVHNDNKLQCDKCGKQYKAKSNLDKHKNGGFGQFGYGSCKGSFTQENSNFKEIRQVKVIKDKMTNKNKNECDVCGKKYSSKNEFAKHNCREYVYTVECDKCGRKCRSESYLKEKHTCKIGVKKEMYTVECDKCGRKCRSESFLKEKHECKNGIKKHLSSPKKKKSKKETNMETDRVITAQHHGYQPSTDHMATTQNRDYQTPTDRTPTMQNHGNQPPLLLYGNNQNANAYAAILRNNQWS